jgi:hypothetical protein
MLILRFDKQSTSVNLASLGVLSNRQEPARLLVPGLVFGETLEAQKVGLNTTVLL